METNYEARDRQTYYLHIAKALTFDAWPAVKILDLAAGGRCILEKVVRAGADYTAVEIRANNVRSLRNQLNQISDRARVVQGNAVRFTDHVGGRQFDVIFVAGLLYHLNVPDQVTLLRNAVDRAGKGLVLCTVLTHEIMNMAPTYYAFDGYIYEARTYFEHCEQDSEELIEARYRASFQKPGERYPSCVFTEDSLVRLMRKLGCTLVTKYNMAPMVGDAPQAAPPNTDNGTRPFTALMNNERGTLVVPLGPGLREPERTTGLVADPDLDPTVPLHAGDLEGMRPRVARILAAAGRKNGESVLEVAHKLAAQLPLSLHNVIPLGALDANSNLETLLHLRIYLASWLRTCNDHRADAACKSIQEYINALAGKKGELGMSMLHTIRCYLWQHLPPKVRAIVEELEKNIQSEIK